MLQLLLVVEQGGKWLWWVIEAKLLFQSQIVFISSLLFGELFRPSPAQKLLQATVMIVEFECTTPLRFWRRFNSHH